MRKFIEKLYKIIFEDEEDKTQVTYKHKLIVVSISIVLFLTISIMITREIIKNASQIN